MEKKTVVLIADDDDHNREALGDAFDFFGHEVISACNGNELEVKAKEIIETETRPYVVVVDNQMPDKDNDLERQWCGLEKILNLCQQYPDKNIAAHVLFLSRWGFEDLPDDLKETAKQNGLSAQDKWLNVFTPFVTLKGHIEQILKAT